MHYGDIASKCYIILKGSVNIYVPRDNKALNEEISNKTAQIPEHILKKLAEWRRKFKEFFLKNRVKDDMNYMKGYRTLQRKATFQLNPEIISKLTEDLNISQVSFPEENEENEENDDNSMNSMNLPMNLAKNPKNPKNFLESFVENTDKITDSFTENFSENEKEQLKKIEKILGGFPLFYLEDPEKYFQNGVFKFHFSNVLKSGQIFGEVGPSMKKARSATVICNEDCVFAVLAYEDFKRILKNVEKKNIENRVGFFKESMFKGLHVDVIIRMSLLFNKKKYFQGNTLYGEGEIANEMFLIKKGEVQVF